MTTHRFSHLLGAFVTVALATCCTGNASNQGAAGTAQERDTTTHTVTLLFAGDLMQHEPQIRAARQSDGTYNYTDVFARVKPEISRPDLAIANLEVTLAGPPYRGYPQFCAPDAYLEAIVDAGFDVLLTSNNHSVDTYAKGINRTIDMIDSLHIPHLGTYKNAAEREKQYPFIIERNGIRICMLNFTYATNGIPVPAPCIVNMLNRDEISKDIAKAKTLHPDVIIAFPHWGIEYAQLPNKEQREWVDWLLDQGVDHIIGGHPHVVQPFEVVERNGKKHLVVYSLGNYVSNQSKPNTYGGAMVDMTLTKKDSVTTMSQCDYSLVFVTRPAVTGNKNYRIYPAGYPSDSMKPVERNLRDSYLKSTRALFQKHNKGIEEKIVK